MNRRYADPLHDPARGTSSLDQYNVGIADWVLGLLAFPVLLFVLMAVTTGTAEWVEKPRPRRLVAAACIVVELLIASGIWWLVVAA